MLQIIGRKRDASEVEVDIETDQAKELALNAEQIKSHIEGKTVTKVIGVPDRLVNIVVK